AVDALVENDSDARQNCEIDKDQDREGRTEDLEPERIEILREGTMQNDNIHVEDFSTGELPRNIQLLAKVDEEIGPFPPAPQSQNGEDYHNQTGSGPLFESFEFSLRL